MHRYQGWNLLRRSRSQVSVSVYSIYSCIRDLEVQLDKSHRFLRIFKCCALITRIPVPGLNDVTCSINKCTLIVLNLPHDLLVDQNYTC